MSAHVGLSLKFTITCADPGGGGGGGQGDGYLAFQSILGLLARVMYTRLWETTGWQIRLIFFVHSGS